MLRLLDRLICSLPHSIESLFISSRTLTESFANATPIREAGSQAGPGDRQSSGVKIQPSFKGEESGDTNPGASAKQPLQNVDQPPQYSTVVWSSGAHGETAKHSLPAKPHGTPAAKPATGSDQQERSSLLECDSKRGVQSMDRHSSAEPRVDSRPVNADERSGPSGIVMESSAGIFTNASNVVINQPTMIDRSRIIHIKNTLSQQKTVLDVLCKEMTRGADLDSSARWPQPSCYLGTRVKLQTKIHEWFLSDVRNWDFLWLNGPAGVGKSAVAQTVAEYALENGILGAVYFFSRPNKRNKYAQVFITLAYQLAVRFPGYQAIVGAKLAAEPDLLTKTPRIQFRKLIVEPLSSLSHERRRVIILDGLDECDNEDNQLEIIELINHLRSNTSLPVIWMVCSRPESHLKRIFARPDYAIQCWSDTETFIRGRFKEIHERYGECVEEDAGGSWPPEVGVKQIVEKTSGLFVLAIPSSDTLMIPKPAILIDALTKFLYFSRAHASLIPSDEWYITRQVLVASTFRTVYDRLAVQPICNLLGISRAKFYVAMRRLHSAIRIPEPSDAAEAPLHFFHATFLDYLTDRNRAGRFFIGKLVTADGVTVAARLRDFVLPGLQRLGTTAGLALTWERVEGNAEISRLLKTVLSWPSQSASANWKNAREALSDFREFLFELLSMLLAHSELDDELLDVLRRFDFNSLPFTVRGGEDYLDSLPSRLCQLRPSSLFRTQSISELDQTLLSEVAKQHPGLKPFDSNKPDEDGFFLPGNDANSVAVVLKEGNDFAYVLQKTLPQIWPALHSLSSYSDDEDSD
ncbi:hypothetical protein P691DRAFT_761896 [Macrolepiota fuliginosa MF-IS2]|uniref:Nephrocystin 3-like N-terminal domain-containing protein n=1 Tax=Macrolepiota fuliginosa MF-IS2 TaxID=1400762 RepID=A0A9P6C2A5_9AGAR|nr:hypothetical protein P691DRAFT_761896 [Macrolepiota fuliginosa MF-IS2]